MCGDDVRRQSRNSRTIEALGEADGRIAEDGEACESRAAANAVRRDSVIDVWHTEQTVQRRHLKAHAKSTPPEQRAAMMPLLLSDPALGSNPFKMAQGRRGVGRNTATTSKTWSSRAGPQNVAHLADDPACADGTACKP
ncbi:MAG TPA: hypothetical protein VFI22_04290 [Thermomicrobiales bacterium]|nr:hypothetical protein [Thermomicrobiales bacterium]